MAATYVRAATAPRPPRSVSMSVSSVINCVTRNSHGVSLTKSVSAGRTFGLMN